MGHVVGVMRRASNVKIDNRKWKRSDILGTCFRVSNVNLLIYSNDCSFAKIIVLMYSNFAQPGVISLKMLNLNKLLQVCLLALKR